MRPSERVDHLVEIRDLQRRIDVGHVTATRKLVEFAGGYPNGSNGSGKGGHSDRTGALALKSDPFTRDLALFDASLELARDALREAHRIMLIATKHEVQDEALPACRSCTRVTDHKGTPVYSPVSSSQLCRWCADFNRQYGGWPDVRILEYRARYGKVTEQIVARYTKARA